jgi:hypothetical protein
MSELSKAEAAQEAAKAELDKMSVQPKRGWLSKLAGSRDVVLEDTFKISEVTVPQKRGRGRPRKDAEVTPRSEVGAQKRKPGRPIGSGKRGPGRPPKDPNAVVAKRGPGRPKGAGKRKPGRPKRSVSKKRGRKPGRKAAILKGYVKAAEAKRIAKQAVAKLKSKIPGIVKRELKKLL